MKRFVLPLICAVVFLGCSKREEAPGKESHRETPSSAGAESHQENLLTVEETMLRDLRLTTAVVEERTGGEGTSMLGELEVNQNSYAEVGAPVTSRVLNVMANVGDNVRAGNPMAILQSADLGRARSELLSAQARLESARRTLDRKRRLANERIVAEREVHDAEALLTSAEAEVRAARAAVRALGVDDTSESDSPDLTLRAPVSGMVIERKAVKGELADPARPLFRIADLSLLWLTVHAFESDAVRVRAGSPARVVFAAIPGRAYSGTVTLIGKQVDAESRTVPVRIDIRNKDGQLRPGMSATASLTVSSQSEKVLSVPTAALQRLEERWIVFVPRSAGQFEMRDVGRGRDLAGEVEIVSGLARGETVVVEGSYLLRAQAERAHGAGEHHDH